MACATTIPAGRFRWEAAKPLLSFVARRSHCCFLGLAVLLCDGGFRSSLYFGREVLDLWSGSSAEAMQRSQGQVEWMQTAAQLRELSRNQDGMWRSQESACTPEDALATTKKFGTRIKMGKRCAGTFLSSSQASVDAGAWHTTVAPWGLCERPQSRTESTPQRLAPRLSQSWCNSACVLARVLKKVSSRNWHPTLIRQAAVSPRLVVVGVVPRASNARHVRRSCYRSVPRSFRPSASQNLPSIPCA